MSPRPRIPSLSLASTLVVGLCAATGVAPPAAADPCEGASAAAQPAANQAFQIPQPSAIAPFDRPIGHKPVGANDQAPLPTLGKMLINAFMPNSGQVQKQAAVAPAPKPAPAQPQPAPAAAQPAPSTAPPGTSVVGWVTGPDSPNQTVQKFAITGTDLGIMWDNGDPSHRQVLLAFGDTNGFCMIPGKQWRYNTLMRSSDGSLANTVAVPDGAVGNKYSGAPVWRPGIAKQVINSINGAPQETGIIPTSGVAVGPNQFLNFMSIRSWDNYGAWTTNYSAIATSTDNGETWGVYPGTVRQPSNGNEKFQMGAFLKPGPGDPYIYSFGTPNGRGGSAYVARVSPGLIPDLTKYEYWNADSNSWVAGSPAAATPVIPGPVGEMSAQFNNYLKQYLVLYCNGNNDVVMRTAPAPQGPWGPEQMLVSSMQIPGGIYAPFLHPWSTGRELYYNLSLWSAYNVMLMHTVLP
ncbi:DUF4185 domain-containing protein [Mycolicibacterium rhodesiae]|uniref:DUF4185 domain-containing protein n=1 Tax=Mycolicibacterium rhodesiae TaxID=36814 RepID=UPI0009F47E2A|nr:DUF4185 domain-containing protein [Mycolicibacterium rhodesiae]MCV7345468.1 DUF4185 domain-containing protein [Mycolicibacterium rhodesiae]